MKKKRNINRKLMQSVADHKTIKKQYKNLVNMFKAKKEHKLTSKGTDSEFIRLLKMFSLMVKKKQGQI